jgi:hypothetical protein
LSEELLNQLIALAKQFHLTKLVQFGSSLESFDDCRDVDFACDGLNDKSFFSFGADLEKLFNKQIDLIPLDPTDKFSEYILKNGRLIYVSDAN